LGGSDGTSGQLSHWEARTEPASQELHPREVRGKWDTDFPQSLSRRRLGTGFPLLVGIPPDPR